MNYLQKELYDLVKADSSIFLFIQNAALDGLWYWDIDNPENEWMDNKFWKTLGYDPDKMPHESAAWQRLVHPEDLQEAKVNIKNCLEDPDLKYDQILRYAHLDGHTIWIRCRGMVIRNEDGIPIRMLGAHNDITKLKRSELLLEESSSLARIGHWEYNLVANTIYWSKVTKEIHGVEFDYIPDIDSAISFFNGNVYKNKIQQVVEEAINHEKEYEEELQIINRQGEVIWVIAKGKPEFKNGKCVRLYGTFQDINSRKLAELELKESNERNKIFVSQNPNALAMFDREMNYLAASHQWYKEYNLIGQDIIGKCHYDIFPAIGEDWKKIHQECMNGAINQNDESLFVRADGTRQWIKWDVRPWYISQDNIGGLLMYTNDITEKKIADEKLILSEAHFRSAFEFSAIGMSLVSLDGHWLKVNRKLCQMLGYSEEELLSTTFQEITHPEDLNTDLAQVKKVIDNEIDSYRMEKRYFHKKGHVVWVLLSVSMVRNPEGEPLHFVSQIEDITNRKLVEEELRQVTDRLIFATRAAKMGIWDLNPATGHLIWDEMMFQIYATKRSEFTNTKSNWLSTMRGDDTTRIEHELHLAIIGEKEFDTHFEIEWPDGSVRDMRAVAWIRRNHHGEATSIIGASWDITQQKRTDEALRRADALESKNKEMEQFAYITSHDLREPLLTIKNYLELLVEEYTHKLDEDANLYISAACKAVGRMEQLILGLLDYSRLSSPKKLKFVDTNEILKSVTEDLNSLIKSSNAIIEYQELPRLGAYPLEFKLLFQNLIHNAIKFGRKDVIPRISISSRKIEGGWKFMVSDNGIGISQNDIKKVFVIFRKAHRRGEYEGTGIGLAHVKKIVEIHQGEIWLESDLEKGTTFHFTILTEMIE